MCHLGDKTWALGRLDIGSAILYGQPYNISGLNNLGWLTWLNLPCASLTGLKPELPSITHEQISLKGHLPQSFTEK